MTQYEEDEKLCYDGAMAVWYQSLKRSDLTEEDRVKGALLAYQRHWFAIVELRKKKITECHKL